MFAKLRIILIHMIQSKEQQGVEKIAELMSKIGKTKKKLSTIMNTKTFFSSNEVCQLLDIAKHCLDYLFNSRKLKKEKFHKVGKVLLFTEKDIEEVKKALASVRPMIKK